MILQALKEYYDRKLSDPDSGIAPEGFEKKEIPFIVVINSGGAFVGLEDTREKHGNRLIGKAFILPRSQQRSGSKSYEKTFLLWDHIGYLFGHPKNEEKALKQHQAWLSALNALPDRLKKDDGVAAVLRFYATNGVEAVRGADQWAECAKLLSCNMTFRLAGDVVPVSCRPIVQDYVREITTVSGQEEDSTDAGLFGFCFVTGEYGEIVRIHGRTPINKDTKCLVGFQKNSGYDSYGKEQGYNAPVGKSAESAYTTALNTLLKSAHSKMQIGDAVTVCWAAKKEDAEFEEKFAFFFDAKDDPDQNVLAVKSLFQSIETGAFNKGEGRHFYVLGLSPNAARISVRFWIVDTVANMAGKICKHFDDIQITHAQKDRDVLPLKQLLKAISSRQEEKNIPPNLAGDTMRAILEGRPYPETLLQASIRRILAERDVGYPRAALIKACLNRKNLYTNHGNQEEIKVSLDHDNMNAGYRLGRLFATLEKIQEDASPGINATIRDRFYGAASSSPVTVFGNLMRLKNHHLSKLENVGRRVNFERLIGEIMSGIGDFPAHLPLADQGRFAIGYYHQRQDFFTKKSDKE